MHTALDLLCLMEESGLFMFIAIFFIDCEKAEQTFTKKVKPMSYPVNTV